jgi:DNA-binding transcriptional MerR regulator/effector-binding domain-containing protein
VEFRIGDFSLVTRLTVKALRHYHEEGILVPDRTDAQTGYRYYGEAAVGRARLIRRLRDLEFGIPEIAAVLEGHDRGEDILPIMEAKARETDERIDRLKKARADIERAMAELKEGAVGPLPALREVRAATIAVEAAQAVSIAYRGPYGHVGKGFAELAKRFGPHTVGPPFCLYYQTEYVDEADIGVCMRLRPGAAERLGKKAEGYLIDLPAGHMACILHYGPYERLGESYSRILAYIDAKGLKAAPPIREEYLKGPGAFFPRDPETFQTRISIPMVRP